MDKSLESLKNTAKKSTQGLAKSLPVLLGVIFTIGFINTVVPPTVYQPLFNQNPWLDSVLGAFLGSIMAGTPLTSYVLGGEFLDQGVSLIAVTAFLVAWVTVGVVQLPMEIKTLGIRFALWRNATSFGLAVLVALATVGLTNLL